MEFNKKIINTPGIKIYLEKDGRQVARATLFILENEFRNRQFGYLEDVFVDESLRGQGVGTELVKEIIKIAKEKKCYKIVATSRYERKQVHELYEGLGFVNFGIEYKMYLENLDN
jgi:GNAT superfamily N-acetyltransferase